MASKYCFTFVMCFSLTSSVFCADPDPHVARAIETRFHEFNWEGNSEPLFAVVRNGQLERVDKRDLRTIDTKSGTLLIAAESLEQKGHTFVATKCHFLTMCRQVQVRGEASVFEFDGNSQIATLTDANIRSTIAVVGPDLTDFSSVSAKKARLDLKKFRVVLEEAVATINFAPRE